MNKTFWKAHGFLIALLICIIAGSIAGFFMGERAVLLRPFGDIFLNLLFTAVVPLVFFSMASAVAVMDDLRRLGRVFGWMMLVFVGTGIVASLVMIAGVRIFLPMGSIAGTIGLTPNPSTSSVADQIVRAFTTPNFSDLLSRENMLALIIFALLVGVATALTREKGQAFRAFLVSGNEVMGKLIGLIMLYAPIGLGAYFAYLVGAFGPQLLGTYAHAMAVYYPLAIVYFGGAFTLYAWLAGGDRGVKAFWAHIIPTSLTAWGTGSSVATVPLNLEAAHRIGVPKDIREVVIPLGATIHMEGSCLAAVLKIAVLFALFQMPFSGVGTILTALGVALLAGVVVSGIPGGGMLGEVLIITLYGFPMEALPVITMVGSLVDPPATMVNAVGDNVASMMVARILHGKNWMDQGKQNA